MLSVPVIGCLSIRCDARYTNVRVGCIRVASDTGVAETQCVIGKPILAPRKGKPPETSGRKTTGLHPLGGQGSGVTEGKSMMFIDRRPEKIVRQGNAQTLFLPSNSIIPLLRDLLHAISSRLGVGQSGGVQC